jgi:hypothetical protein
MNAPTYKVEPEITSKGPRFAVVNTKTGREIRGLPEAVANSIAALANRGLR